MCFCSSEIEARRVTTDKSERDLYNTVTCKLQICGDSKFLCFSDSGIEAKYNYQSKSDESTQNSIALNKD